MDARTALMLQLEWGADEALAETPRDRRTRPAAAAPAPEPAPLVRAPPTTPLARAQSIAAGAASRSALRAALAAFDGCALSATATNLVFESGDPACGVVLIADVPAAAEDRTGAPFAGPAGAFLDRMLASIGLSLETVFATSLLPWRPPGDRKPADAEVQLCAPFLWRHLTLLQPRFVLLMGALTVRTLLPAAGRRPQGRWHNLEAPGVGPVPALALGTPGHVQAAPSAKRDAWGDLLRLRRALDADGGSHIGDPRP